MSGNYSENQLCRILKNSENHVEVEVRNAGIRFHETRLEAESLSRRTVSSVSVEVILNPFQGPPLVLVERVEKGNLTGSVYYFQIVDFRVR